MRAEQADDSMLSDAVAPAPIATPSPEATTREDQDLAARVGDDAPLSKKPTGELVRLAKLPQAELMVDVTIESNDPTAYFEVDSDKNGASLIICGNPCNFRIWPGRYRLLTTASSRFVGGRNPMTVERDALVQVQQPRVIRPVIGAVLGSLGVASALLGALLLATNTCSSPCQEQTLTRNQVGFATIGAGLVIAPIGWMIFGQSRNPELSVVARDSGHPQ